MKKNPINNRGQVSLIPAWNTGDYVEIIGTGMEGRCLTPVGIQMDVWYVRVSPTRIVRAHATGLRVPSEHNIP